MNRHKVEFWLTVMPSEDLYIFKTDLPFAPVEGMRFEIETWDVQVQQVFWVMEDECFHVYIEHGESVLPLPPEWELQ